MMIPEGVDLKTWAASLIVDFPDDNIPLYLPFKDDEKAWKLWGSLLVEQTSFSNNGAPGPGEFKTAKPWAKNVFRAMVDF